MYVSQRLGVEVVAADNLSSNRHHPFPRLRTFSSRRKHLSLSHINTQDIIALVVQAVGGAIASTAAEQGTDPAKGGNIMLGGIVFQLVAIVAYSILAAEFLIRYIVDKPIAGHELADTNSRRVRTPLKMKLLLFGMGFMTVLIFIRCVLSALSLRLDI